jgi:hypothetical protein
MKLSEILSDKDEVTVTVKLTGKPACVERIMSLLGMIAYNGAVGHSGTFGTWWDGDGSDKIKIEGPIPDHKDAWNVTSSHGGYVELIGEGRKYYVVTGKDLSTKCVWPKEEE